MPIFKTNPRRAFRRDRGVVHEHANLPKQRERESRVRSSLFVASARQPSSEKERRNDWCVRARSELAHLAPSLVHSITQVFDLVALGHVRREGDQVPLAYDLRDLFRGLAQALLIYIRNRDLKPDPV